MEDIFLQKLRDIVYANLGDSELNVDRLAEAAGLGQPQLYRKLKALTGETPNSFVRNIRLQKGMELVKSAELNIAEIAYAVGFKDPNYFSRAFHKLYGDPPSVFRK